MCRLMRNADPSRSQQKFALHPKLWLPKNLAQNVVGGSETGEVYVIYTSAGFHSGTIFYGLLRQGHREHQSCRWSSRLQRLLATYESSPCAYIFRCPTNECSMGFSKNGECSFGSWVLSSFGYFSCTQNHTFQHTVSQSRLGCWTNYFALYAARGLLSRR